MSIKLVVLKSGETVITDAKELIVEDKVCGYLFNKPHKVEYRKPILLSEEAEMNSGEVQISLSPWILLTADKQIPVPTDWLEKRLMIKCLILQNGLILIAKIEEIDAEIGDPNCKISDVALVNSDDTVSTWLTCTEQKDLLFRSEDILTIVEPKSSIIKSYMEIIA